jgi:hypothetical protein
MQSIGSMFGDNHVFGKPDRKLSHEMILLLEVGHRPVFIKTTGWVPNAIHTYSVCITQPLRSPR